MHAGYAVRIWFWLGQWPPQVLLEGGKGGGGGAGRGVAMAMSRRRARGESTIMLPHCSGRMYHTACGHPAVLGSL